MNRCTSHALPTEPRCAATWESDGVTIACTRPLGHRGHHVHCRPAKCRIAVWDQVEPGTRIVARIAGLRRDGVCA